MERATIQKADLQIPGVVFQGELRFKKWICNFQG